MLGTGGMGLERGPGGFGRAVARSAGIIGSTGEASMPVTVSELCKRHRVDMAHARHVAKMSLALFDGLERVHRLPAARRRFLEIAGILHDIAYAEDPEHHNTTGRDFILAESIAGLGARERDMLACMTRFHRKKARPEKEPVFQTLPSRARDETLALAALLRIGDALDYSRTQTSRIVAIELMDSSVRLVVDGAHAEEEAARANKKADLWNSLFGCPLKAMTVAQAPSSQRPLSPVPHRPASPSRKGPGIRPEDPIADAGCKVLGLYFAQLNRHEAGVRAGKDIRALHQMRTATRRLRAAMRLFGPYFPAKPARRLEKALRRLTRVLGPVRDLDVFLERAESYGKALPKSRRKTLEPLLKFWRRQRTAARRKMLRYLDGPRYGDLKRDFEALLAAEVRIEDARRAQQAADRKPRADLVRHVVPSLLWDHYQRVRAYETVLEGAPIETLHALRIECKRLRYTLELLHEALGKSSDAAIAEVRRAQDHLGELHDADVAVRLAEDFLDRWRRRHRARKDGDERVKGVAEYRDACAAEVRNRMATFAGVWARLVGADFRRLLAEITASL